MSVRRSKPKSPNSYQQFIDFVNEELHAPDPPSDPNDHAAEQQFRWDSKWYERKEEHQKNLRRCLDLAIEFKEMRQQAMPERIDPVEYGVGLAERFASEIKQFLPENFGGFNDPRETQLSLGMWPNVDNLFGPPVLQTNTVEGNHYMAFAQLFSDSRGSVDRIGRCRECESYFMATYNRPKSPQVFCQTRGRKCKDDFTNRTKTPQQRAEAARRFKASLAQQKIDIAAAKAKFEKNYGGSEK